MPPFEPLINDNNMTYLGVTSTPMMPCNAFMLRFQDLDSSLQSLTTQFEKATAEKISCQEEVASTNQTIALANRLVKGLEVSRE